MPKILGWKVEGAVLGGLLGALASHLAIQFSVLGAAADFSLVGVGVTVAAGLGAGWLASMYK